MREPVDDGTRVQAEHEDRAVAESAKESEGQGGVVGKLQHEPRGRHRLHPGAHNRQRLADEIAPEFGVLKSGDLENGATARLYGSRSGWNAISLLRCPLAACNTQT